MSTRRVRRTLSASGATLALASILRALRAMRRPGTRRVPRATAAVGRRGEDVAARHLRRAGYRILHRNLRLRRDEADIVALAPDGATVVIVEVKTRAGDFAAPEVNVDGRKRRNLRRLAMRLRTMPAFAGRPVRFDVVAVRLRDDASPVIRHYVGAF